MVTAELALAVPAVLLVLALCLAGLTLAVDQVRCVDAARVGARAASRGETTETVQALVGRLAPEGARVEVRAEGAGVTVVVRAARPSRLLPGLPAGRASATAPWEPGAQP